MHERSRFRITLMKEITLTVDQDEESGWLVASWDEPSGKGGITTQGKDLRELQQMVKDAVLCHFGKGKAPKSIRLRFLTDAVLATT